jgi:hypothetical protein
MAIVVKTGCAESPVVSRTYTITGKVATPTMTPAPGTYATAKSISLSTSTPGATIWFTTDNTDPSPTNGTQYSASFQISHNTTIKAKAYLANWDPSDIATGVYTLDIVYATLSSATPLTGALSVDSKMTAANSPYHIGANYAVASGVILLIEPGVTVKFDGNYFMRIDGTLIANGTSGSQITFTANSSTSKGAWNKLQLASTTSEISYCNFYYADRAISVESDAYPASISHCTFSTNNFGFYTSNNSWQTGSLTLGSCTFNGNTTGVENVYSYGLTVNVSQSTVSNGTSGLWAQGPITVDHSTVSGCQTGAFVNGWYAPLQIRQSQITGNQTGLSTGSGQSITTVSQTTFQSNTTCGIRIENYSSACTLSVSNCNLLDTVAVQNNQSFDYDFKNNYWGTTDTVTIASQIYDFFDNVLYGTINYTPFLTTTVTW